VVFRARRSDRVGADRHSIGVRPRRATRIRGRQPMNPEPSRGKSSPEIRDNRGLESSDGYENVQQPGVGCAPERSKAHAGLLQRGARGGGGSPNRGLDAADRSAVHRVRAASERRKSRASTRQGDRGLHEGLSLDPPRRSVGLFLRRATASGGRYRGGRRSYRRAPRRPTADGFFVRPRGPGLVASRASHVARRGERQPGLFPGRRAEDVRGFRGRGGTARRIQQGAADAGLGLRMRAGHDPLSGRRAGPRGPRRRHRRRSRIMVSRVSPARDLSANRAVSAAPVSRRLLRSRRGLLRFHPSAGRSSVGLACRDEASPGSRRSPPRDGPW
jgi:hypothetical protein